MGLLLIRKTLARLLRLRRGFEPRVICSQAPAAALSDLDDMESFRAWARMADRGWKLTMFVIRPDQSPPLHAHAVIKEQDGMRIILCVKPSRLEARRTAIRIFAAAGTN